MRDGRPAEMVRELEEQAIRSRVYLWWHWFAAVAISDGSNLLLLRIGRRLNGRSLEKERSSEAEDKKSGPTGPCAVDRQSE